MPVSPIDVGEPSTHTTLLRETKEASQVDEDDSSQEQTENEHASKDNEDGEDDGDGEGYNEDRKADDKTKEENDENVCSTPAEASSSGRDQSTTSTEIVVKNIRITVIGRDLVGAEKDDVASKAINEVVASYTTCEAIRTDDDHHSCGGGFTPFDAGGIGSAGGRYTPVVEEVRRQEDTPYMLGRSSAVGSLKVPFYACRYLKCNENMNMLLSKIEALT
ncbi:hypothetical protein HAX54_039527 [Datura stramonium]|uniref:Uncharacterized protein n=1 Tax=Datura stramonium TaxID=4076 RepID=A0ABS8VMX0_DATST|nr:hypothetical protein [Datura stramonium]